MTWETIGVRVSETSKSREHGKKEGSNYNYGILFREFRSLQFPVGVLCVG